jgi:hypothetical protein
MAAKKNAQKSAAPEGKILVKLGEKSDYGRVGIPAGDTGQVTNVSRTEAAYIDLEDFKRLEREYGLEIAETEDAETPSEE